MAAMLCLHVLTGARQGLHVVMTMNVRRARYASVGLTVSADHGERDDEWVNVPHYSSFR